MSDSTVSELENNIEQVKNESRRLTGLMEQSLQITESLRSSGTLTDVKSLEREMWRLERECRLFSYPRSKSPAPSPSPTKSPFCPPTDVRNELLSTKEELAALKRQMQHITSPLPPPALSHSRHSTAEHHHHHYYYHLPEYSRDLPQHSPAAVQDTPVPTKIFRELPTPPLTASSSSSVSLRHDRFNSALSTWPQIDIEEDSTPGLRRKASYESILTTISKPTPLNFTPKIKRSASHESILGLDSTPSFRRITSPHQLPQSSPLSSSATSSPTYLSASAYLRQNNTSSLLLLSSARGKQFRGLSSRKSFWNIWDSSSSRLNRGTSSLRNVSAPSALGRPVVICTEVNIGMLQDALEG
jgi:hypothetical protein